METMQGLHRTHGCGTISEQEVGKEVVLCGWVERRRDHGGLIFLDLRDRSGVVQVVASPDHNVESFKICQTLRSAYITAEMDGQGKSMKAQLKYANKINAKYVIILGDDELARGEAIIRFMETSEQETVPLDTVSERITSLVKG